VSCKPRVLCESEPGKYVLYGNSRSCGIRQPHPLPTLRRSRSHAGRAVQLHGRVSPPVHGRFLLRWNHVVYVGPVILNYAIVTNTHLHYTYYFIRPLRSLNYLVPLLAYYIFNYINFFFVILLYLPLWGRPYHNYYY